MRMPERPKNKEKELATVWDAFSEAIARSSDEEILAQVCEEARDPRETGVRVRALLKSTVKSHQQAKLREAEQHYRQRVIELYEAKHALPQEPEARRNLLSDVFKKIPDMRSALLTAQHREFGSLTDADITSCLKQLAYLGVLDKLSDSGDKK